MPSDLRVEWLRGMVRLIERRVRTIQRDEGIGYREGFLQGPTSPVGGATFGLEGSNAALAEVTVGYDPLTGCLTSPMIADFSIVAVDTGAAQGGTSGSITLAATASAVDDIYNDMPIYICSGTGACQQQRIIVDYDGTTKIAAIIPNWTTVPDATSVYAIGTCDLVLV